MEDRTMKLAMVGLGRMGGNMVKRLLGGGHEVVAYARTEEKIKPFVELGALGTTSLEQMVEMLPTPRVVWIMVPAGKPVEDTLTKLSGLLSKGDIIIEGGNSKYTDDIRHQTQLQEKGIQYLDIGVSGGIWGLKVGYCMMIGGEKETYSYIEPILKTLAPPEGYLYCGASGAGHFTKMVHNGIEYAMMEAYGEGFELLKASPYGEQLDLAKVSHLWNQGSVVRSWLLELLESAFSKDGDLSQLSGYVEDSGEGRWTVEAAIEHGVAATGIAHALFKRFSSRQQDSFSDKVLAALRNEVGGHAVSETGSANRESSAGAGQVTAAKPQTKP
jgi:6-phosphogluconate dehydrogenase